MSLLFIIYMLSTPYNTGDCIKYTLPNAEGIPMLITDEGDGWYDVFYVYPGIGDIHFRAIDKKLERDTKLIDKSKCNMYNKKLGHLAS